MSMTLDEMKREVCRKLPNLISIETNNDNEEEREFTYFVWKRAITQGLVEDTTGCDVTWETEGLQVCHEAEKLLKGLEIDLYKNWLNTFTGERARISACAPYEQRLEALCRVWYPARFVTNTPAPSHKCVYSEDSTVCTICGS